MFYFDLSIFVEINLVKNICLDWFSLDKYVYANMVLLKNDKLSGLVARDIPHVEIIMVSITCAWFPPLDRVGLDIMGCHSDDKAGRNDAIWYTISYLASHRVVPNHIIHNYIHGLVQDYIIAIASALKRAVYAELIVFFVCMRKKLFGKQWLAIWHAMTPTWCHYHKFVSWHWSDLLPETIPHCYHSYLLCVW